jgi:GDSL-like Lipase/Acylhydrolase family
MRFLPRLGSVALVVLSTLLGLFAAEGILRAFKLWAIPDYSAMNWYRRSSIPGVPYLLKTHLRGSWGIGQAATDDFGLRNDHPAAKPAGVYRILMLGDSVTFGFGVDQKQSFPAVLEELLNKNEGARYQVINAGVPGFNIADEGALLPTLLTRYKPDLVLWTIVSNDYDDSLGIDDGGRITASNADYVVDVNHLSSWGYDGRPYIDVDDFRRSMLPRVSARADTWDSWLRSHLFVYSMVANRAAALPKFPGALKPTEAELLGRYTTAQGRHWLMQFFSAVFSSRRAINRANQVLERARNLSQQNHVPIVLINDGLPMDRDWMESRENIVYQDLSDYLGESAVDFFFHHGLGWDSHPNVAGNRIIAKALQRMLGCRGYIPGKDGCDMAAATAVETGNYWNQFQQRRRQFVAKYYGPIDLDQFRGVHQIVGGIFPSRDFPGPVAHRANMLLPLGPWKSLTITGTLAGASSMMLRTTIFAGDRSTVRDSVVGPGEVAIRLDLTPLADTIANLGDPMELQLQCIGDSCPPMRLHRISVDRGTSREP